eukprot:3474272-Rhodomonas_salina.1
MWCTHDPSPLPSINTTIILSSSASSSPPSSGLCCSASRSWTSFPQPAIAPAEPPSVPQATKQLEIAAETILFSPSSSLLTGCEVRGLLGAAGSAESGVGAREEEGVGERVEGAAVAEPVCLAQARVLWWRSSKARPVSAVRRIRRKRVEETCG